MTIPLTPLNNNVVEEPPKPSGGAGAAEHMLNVAGNMNQQQTGADGSLAYKMPVVTGGVGVTEALVPAVLVLANTKLSKNWLRNSGLSGKTLKKGLSINGGSNELAKTGIEQHVGGKQTMNTRFLKRSRRSRSSKQNRKSKRRFRGKR